MLPIEPTIHVPLRHDPDGTIRIGETRVLLERVIYAFQQGQDAEDISRAYSLKLVEVYTVISFYLQHRAEVDAYLEAVEEKAQAIRAKIEASQPDTQQILASLRQRTGNKEQKNS